MSNPYQPLEVGLSFRPDDGAMIERYERISDSDDLPGGPIEAIPLDSASLPCGLCGRAAASWAYAVSIAEDGSLIIDGRSVCEAHRAVA